MKILQDLKKHLELSTILKDKILNELDETYNHSAFFYDPVNLKLRLSFIEDAISEHLLEIQKLIHKENMEIRETAKEPKTDEFGHNADDPGDLPGFI